MAVRRMLHGAVLGSDSFQSMPFSSQMLYVQISMAADDDGFLNGPERLQRAIGARPRDLQILIEKRFLLMVDGVAVVKHWRMANSLKNDRIKALAYPEIAEKLYLKPNRSYTDHPGDGAVNLAEYRNHLLEKRNPFGIPVEEKGKEEKGKEMKRAEAEASGIQTAAAAGEILKKLEGTLGKGVLMLTESQTEDLLNQMGLDGFDYYTDKLSSFILKNNAKIKNHYETLLRWWREDSLINKEES